MGRCDQADHRRRSNRLQCSRSWLHREGARNALAHELRKSGLAVAQHHAITVRYDGMIVGEYAADLLVEGAVIVALEATKAASDIARANA
jgi:GxxExxY protein